MKQLILPLLLISSFPLFAQTRLPKQEIQVSSGPSFAGTGDMRGLIFSSELIRYLKKRLSLALSLTGTIHDGFYPISYYESPGNAVDGSIRYTTAGVQTAGHAGYSFIRTGRHELQMRIGVLLRYQSSSYFDGLNVLYPAATGLPMPVTAFYNKTSQQTYAFGGSSQLSYNYTFKNNVSTGVAGGFQTDTNGDTISQLVLTLGKRF